MSAESPFISGGPGEESTPKIIPVGSRIYFLAVVSLGPLSPFSLPSGGQSQLLRPPLFLATWLLPPTKPSVETPCTLNLICASSL